MVELARFSREINDIRDNGSRFYLFGMLDVNYKSRLRMLCGRFHLPHEVTLSSCRTRMAFPKQLNMKERKKETKKKRGRDARRWGNESSLGDS